MKFLKISFIVVAISFLASPAFSQLYRLRNKIENKVEDAAVDAIFKKKKDKKDELPDDDESEYSAGSSSNPKSRAKNKGGAGLTTTPPDVNKHLTEAETSYSSSHYGKARAALQQAMMGVEMEIGQQILKSLPEAINNLNKDASADQVASAGYGWSGLTIQRIYNDGEDKEFEVIIANNSAMLSAVNLYLANGGYSQTTGEEEEWKQTSLSGHKAVISYDDYDGYKLTVPIGQTSVISFGAVNFENEEEVMKAAENINIDDIMKKLGEQ